MYTKTNPLITALFKRGEEKDAPFSDARYYPHKWKWLRSINKNFFILYRTVNGRTYYAPLFVFSFSFLHFCKLTEGQRFLEEHPNPEKLYHVADKLKWYRYKNMLLQREVAEYAGIDRSTYIHYESKEINSYPADKLEKLAELFGIDVDDLLDDYNRFIYDGQGWKIRKLRKSMGLTQYQFGKIYGVSASAVKRWENGKVRVTKRVWEKFTKKRLTTSN